MDNQALLSIIAAVGAKRELGAGGKLPWHIPEDMRWFRDNTRGHPVIMGRKTFESIGKPLPGRDNIVITRDRTWEALGVFVKYSLDEAVAFARERNREEVFVIGGGEIFEAAMPYVDRIYLTVVHKEFPEADVFFPDYSEFKKITFQKDSQGAHLYYTFLILERK